MKDPAAISPFALKSSQEQKEQWIWWQCQRDALLPVKENMEESDVPPLHVPPVVREEAPQQPIPMRAATHHSQYDAVIRRMKAATKQTGDYTSV